MTLRNKLWWVGGVIYMLINLGGVGYAVAFGQRDHAAVHVVLLAVGAVMMWRLPRRADAGDLTTEQSSRSLSPADERLELLQQSVDAVALEVERIGEAQRFHAKLVAERARKQD